VLRVSASGDGCRRFATPASADPSRPANAKLRRSQAPRFVVRKQETTPTVPNTPIFDEDAPRDRTLAHHDIVDDEPRLLDTEAPDQTPNEPLDPLDDLSADPMLAQLDPADSLLGPAAEEDPDLEALADVDADVDVIVEDEEEEEEELPKASNRVAPRMPGHMPGVPNRPVMHARLPSKAEIFVEGDHVVYPTHGVGKVERIATEEIAGHTLELIHITFEENRMTLRVPVSKARSAGLRKLATRKMFDDAMAVLKGRARIKRTMWSRRAQEYEAKINSGDPLATRVSASGRSTRRRWTAWRPSWRRWTRRTRSPR
jgi:hypothetical protein